MACGGLIHPTAFWTIESALAARGLALISSLIPTCAREDAEVVPRLLREWSVDGMIISHYFESLSPIEEALRAYEKSSIWFNAKNGHNSVYFDDHGAASSATRRLLGLGHRRIAFARAYASIHYSVTDRLGGYLVSMTEAGAARNVLDATHFGDPAQHFNLWLRLLDGPSRPTAILIDDDRLLTKLVCAAKVLRLRVPDDLSIIAISDTSEIVIDLAVDRLLIPFGDAGRAAVKLLSDRLGGAPEPCASAVLPLVVAEGTSVAPPRRRHRSASRRAPIPGDITPVRRKT